MWVGGEWGVLPVKDLARGGGIIAVLLEELRNGGEVAADCSPEGH